MAGLKSNQTTNLAQRPKCRVLAPGKFKSTIPRIIADLF